MLPLAFRYLSRLNLNFTLAIAIFSVAAAHIFGMLSLGFVGYASKFVNIRGIFRAIKHGPMAIIVACVEFCVGLLEIISEFAKMLSLSLRLFGNIFAGEVLLTVVSFLVPYVVPLPFLLLEFFVGFIQALVFAMLTLVFLKMAVTEHEHEEHQSVHGS